ncbi:actin-like ATPase domain-containing protein [Lenzites betulinus]|nr:actin-like ATPase domain-containing protein [Lenzites betulinus]
MAATTNGTAEAPIEVTSVPTIVGINFGNSYASISVLAKEGGAECIANEDGERQIACAIAFHGEEIYIGNQAKHQLVKNSQNTITGFRNLLGKKFSQISASAAPVSAPVIQHPELADEPAYKVKVLQPAPSPLTTTATNTPAASHAATPRSEPVQAERVLTVSEVTSIFLKSLVQSAEDFLGKKVQGAVITIPTWFEQVQKDALEKAANDAGITVLQLLEEAGAAAVCTTSYPLPEGLSADRTQLLVDLGASALSLSLLSIRDGLVHSLATLSDHTVGGDAIDDKLVKFFAKEFTKKTKTALTVAPATDAQDRRAEAKLRLALEHTKRTISASPGAATCSVESLKDGLDFTGTITRLRFDMEVRSVYDRVYAKVQEVVRAAGIDLYDVDEIVYAGGSASLPGLDETLAQGFAETVVTPFTQGTVVGGGIGDPTTILSRGAVLQALILVQLGEATDEEREVKASFTHGHQYTQAKATSKTIGLLFPEETPGEGSLGGQWIPVLLKETPVPARRIVAFDVDLGEGEGEKKLGFEVWEAKEGVKVEKVKVPRLEDEDGGDEEEEEEEEEVKEKTVEKESVLTALSFTAAHAQQKKGRWTTRLEVTVKVNENGGVEVSVVEVGASGKGEKAVATVAAP